MTRKRDPTTGVFLPEEQSEDSEAEEQPGEDLPPFEDDATTDRPPAQPPPPTNRPTTRGPPSTRAREAGGGSDGGGRSPWTDPEPELRLPEETEVPPPGVGEMPEFPRGSVEPPIPIELQRLKQVIYDTKWDPKMKDSLWKEWITLPPEMQRNSQILFNAMIARGASPYLANHVVGMVFRPGEYGAQTFYGAPGYATHAPYNVPPRLEQPLEEDALTRKKREIEERRIHLQDLILDRREMAMLRGLEQETGGGAPGISPGEVLEIVKVAMEMKQGGTPATDILEAIKTGVAVARPSDAGGSNLVAELARFREDFIAKQHEREIGFVRAQGEAEKAMYAATNPLNAARQTAELVKELGSAGIITRSPNPETALKEKELDIRFGLATMKAGEEKEMRFREQDHRQRKEMQETQTFDRLVQVANKAVEVIGDPISKGIGLAIRDRATLPPGASPQVQTQTAVSPQEQVARLDALIAQAQAAKAQIQQQAQAGQAPPTTGP